MTCNTIIIRNSFLIYFSYFFYFEIKAMSSYTDFKNRKGVNMMNVVSRRVKIRGFTFEEFLDRADECF